MAIALLFVLYLSAVFSYPPFARRAYGAAQRQLAETLLELHRAETRQDRSPPAAKGAAHSGAALNS